MLKVALLSMLALFANASPIATRNVLARRQAQESCVVGFCTENGGTTGGAGGEVVTVSTVDALIEAAESEGAKVIVVSGNLVDNARVRVGSDKTIFGESGSCMCAIAPYTYTKANIPLALEGIGFYIRESSNVIMRNLKISKVLAENGDAIGLDRATNVWVDHCDLSGDLDTEKDDYDGLFDVARASDWVTISNTYLHDHVSVTPR